MVNVVVGDKDGLDVLSRQVLLQQFLFELFRADAHVDKQALVLLAHIVAVAATA
jgi:hypothetical protein